MAHVHVSRLTSGRKIISILIDDLTKKDLIVRRFWAKVEKTDSCWFWIGGKNNSGYGSFTVPANQVTSKRFHYASHRFSYELHKGQIPIGLCVCHTCDTPACVNPSHLFIATHAENMRDKTVKGRCVTTDGFLRSARRDKSGELNPKSKLTRENVDLIRSSETHHKVLAQQFCVSKQAILDVRAGKTWA